MFKNLARWLDRQLCRAKNHEPQEKVAYRQQGPDGREYLVAKNCMRCGAKSWFLAWVDLDTGTLAAGTSQFGGTVPNMSGEMILEHGVDLYERHGWRIDGSRLIPSMPSPSRIPDSWSAARTQLG